MTNKPVDQYLQVMYSESVRPITSYPQKLARELVRRFAIQPGSLLLDVGCGRGDFSTAFQQADLKVSGVDISDAASAYVKDIPVSTADFETGSLPYSSDSFDVVFSKSVVEHLSNPQVLLSEILRVLKPGGLVITMCPSWEHQFRIFYADYTHKTPFTRESLGALTTVSGFREVTAQYFVQLPIVWKLPWLMPVSTATRLVIPWKFSRTSKWVRFSKEIMLLGTGRKGQPDHFDEPKR